MDGVTALLTEAQAAGLRVRAEGDRLVIRGPKRAEPLALKLIEHKAEVLRLLAPAPLRPALDFKTLVEVLGLYPTPQEIRVLGVEVAEAMVKLQQEVETGQLQGHPLLVRGRVLADYLGLDQLAEILATWRPRPSGRRVTP